MPTEKKRETVARIKELLSRSTIAIATDYRGLSVAEMRELRRKLGEVECEYHVAKNTLTILAARETGRDEFVSFLHDPTAIALGYGDIAQPARALLDYVRSEKLPVGVKGGIIEGRTLTPDDVSTLSMLPSREALLARLAGTIEAPISSLLFVLTGTARGLLTVLEARKRQLEGGQNA
jgi:large subunit ribosomal protein L10